MAYSTNVRVHTLYRQHATMATHKHATHCTLPRASHHEQLPLVLCLTTPWGSATATLVPDHSGGGKGRGGDTSVQARWGQGEDTKQGRANEWRAQEGIEGAGHASGGAPDGGSACRSVARCGLQRDRVFTVLEFNFTFHQFPLPIYCCLPNFGRSRRSQDRCSTVRNSVSAIHLAG